MQLRHCLSIDPSIHLYLVCETVVLAAEAIGLCYVRIWSHFIKRKLLGFIRSNSLVPFSLLSAPLTSPQIIRTCFSLIQLHSHSLPLRLSHPSCCLSPSLLCSSLYSLLLSRSCHQHYPAIFLSPLSLLWHSAASFFLCIHERRDRLRQRDKEIQEIERGGERETQREWQIIFGNHPQQGTGNGKFTHTFLELSERSEVIACVYTLNKSYPADVTRLKHTTLHWPMPASVAARKLICYVYCWLSPYSKNVTMTIEKDDTVTLNCFLFIIWCFSSQNIWTELVKAICWAHAFQ